MRVPIVASLVAVMLACPAWLRAEDEPSIGKLIKALDDDDFQTRQNASVALGKIGKSALDPLRAALKNTKSPEVAMRAGALIEQIEWRLAGGEPVNGLQAVLRASTKVFRGNERASVMFEIRNVGSEPRRICRIHDVEYEFPRTDALKKVQIAERIVGSKAKLVLKRISGGEAAETVYDTIAKAREQIAIDLQPGLSSGCEFKFICGEALMEKAVVEEEDTPIVHDVPYVLSPGEYEVQVIYVEIDESPLKLNSNAVRFKVEK